MSIYKKLFELKQKELKLSRDKKAFNYSYATLSQIQEKLNPILKELKLIVLHFNKNDKVVTQIRDIEDGSFIESELEIGKVETTTTTKQIFDKQTNNKKIGYSEEKETIEYNEKDAQGVGSIVTYYRRYNLLALLDLETEDDDGKSGSGRARAKESYSNNGKKEKHTCEKCGKIVEVSPFKGKFGMCFKCPECEKFSKLNPVVENSAEKVIQFGKYKKELQVCIDLECLKTKFTQINKALITNNHYIELGKIKDEIKNNLTPKK